MSRGATLHPGGNIIGAGSEIRSGVVALDAATAGVLPWNAPLLLLGEFTTDSTGVATSSVPIPLIPAAWGLTLRAQGGVILPGSFALSAGQELVLGY